MKSFINYSGNFDSELIHLMKLELECSFIQCVDCFNSIMCFSLCCGNRKTENITNLRKVLFSTTRLNFSSGLWQCMCRVTSSKSVFIRSKGILDLDCELKSNSRVRSELRHKAQKLKGILFYYFSTFTKCFLSVFIISYKVSFHSII